MIHIEDKRRSFLQEKLHSLIGEDESLLVAVTSLQQEQNKLKPGGEINLNQSHENIQLPQIQEPSSHHSR